MNKNYIEHTVAKSKNVIKIIIVIIILLIFTTLNRSDNMITIPYTDSNIKYLGRFLDATGYKQSPWQSSQIKFKVKGTSQVIVVTDIADTLTSSACFLAVSIDDGDVVIYYLSTVSEIYTGERTATITIPTSAEHLIIIKTSSGLAEQFNLTSYIRFKSIQIDDTGEMVSYSEANKKLMCIGDSWIAIQNDFPRFIDDYSIYPLAFGGAKASDIEPMYPYKSSGVYNTDIKVDAVIVILGINDYWASISTSSFKSTMTSLVNKIKLDQPPEIFLIQAPRNIGASKNYDQYGTVLNEISNEIYGVTYIPTDEIWSSLVWLSDDSHIDNASQKLFADYISTKVNTHFINQLTINYYVDSVTTTINLKATGDFKVLIDGEYYCLDVVNVGDTTASDIRVYVNDNVMAISKE